MIVISEKSDFPSAITPLYSIRHAHCILPPKITHFIKVVSMFLIIHNKI